MARLLDQYLGGGCEAAWRAACALDLADDTARAEALAVARELASRVLVNLEKLTENLERAGFRFHQPPFDLRVATRDLPGAFERAVDRRLPLALRAFYDTIHAVDLRGAHPAWDLDMADALVVYPLPDPEAEHWDTERAALVQDWAGFDEDYDYTAERPNGAPDPLVLTIAPDAYHKDDVSGSAPYAVLLPAPGAVTLDPTFEGFLAPDGKRVSFVEYLRLCFRAAGFPGLDPGTLPIAELTRGLLSF